MDVNFELDLLEGTVSDSLPREAGAAREALKQLRTRADGKRADYVRALELLVLHAGFTLAVREEVVKAPNGAGITWPFFRREAVFCETGMQLVMGRATVTDLLKHCQRLGFAENLGEARKLLQERCALVLDAFEDFRRDAQAMFEASNEDLAVALIGTRGFSELAAKKFPAPSPGSHLAGLFEALGFGGHDDD